MIILTVYAVEEIKNPKFTKKKKKKNKQTNQKQNSRRKKIRLGKIKILIDLQKNRNKFGRLNFYWYFKK
jgi:hypothetical protein